MNIKMWKKIENFHQFIFVDKMENLTTTTTESSIILSSSSLSTISTALLTTTTTTTTTMITPILSNKDITVKNFLHTDETTTFSNLAIFFPFGILIGMAIGFISLFFRCMPSTLPSSTLSSSFNYPLFNNQFKRSSSWYDYLDFTTSSFNNHRNHNRRSNDNNNNESMDQMPLANFLNSNQTLLCGHCGNSFVMNLLQQESSVDDGDGDGDGDDEPPPPYQEICPNTNGNDNSLTINIDNVDQRQPELPNGNNVV